jgi:hypothetical protein
VAVIDLSGDPSQAMTDLARDIKRALTNHEELIPVLDPTLEQTLRGVLLQDENKDALDEARAAKEAAENALAEFSFADAAKHAVTGMDKLNNVDPAAAIALYADLAFVYGQAKLGEKNPQETNLAFAFVHRLQDRRRVDPSRYLPEVVTAYDKARPAPATLSLDVRGTGRVWIDGVAVGEGDGTYKVGSGWHLIQLSGPDREPRGIRIPKPGDPITIEDAPAQDDLKIKRARLALARATDPADRATVMKHLAELTKVKDAVLLWVANGKFTFQTWRDGAPGYDGPVFLAKSVFDRNKGVDQILDALAPPKKPPKLAEKPIIIPVEPVRWYRKTWVTASAIGTVIAIVGGAIWWSERGPGHTGVNTGIGFDQATSSRPR